MSDAVSIILVNYNGMNYLESCINSIQQQSYLNYEIIIVDNASQDKSIEFIKCKFPKVKLIELTNNEGFGVGCNIGIEDALVRGFKYFLLVNTDTILENNLLELLMKKANQNTVLTPQIYCTDKENNSIENVKKNSTVSWYTGGKIDFKTALVNQNIFALVEEGEKSEFNDINFISGCCMLIPARVVNRVGLFDENYFMYYEDVDYCMRIIEQGFKMQYVPEAKMWHKVGGSAEGEISCLSQYYTTRNRLLFANKYYKNLSVGSLSILQEILQDRGNFQRKEDKKYQLYVEMGIKDFLEKKFGKGFYGNKILKDNYLPIKGFYTVERENELEWFWANDSESEILLTNPSKVIKIYNVSFNIELLNEGKKNSVKIFLDNQFLFDSIIPNKIFFETLILPESQKTIKIEYDGEFNEVKDDHIRKIAFQIINMQVMQKKETYFISKGCYEVEKDETNYWQWAFLKDVNITIINKEKKINKIEITFKVNGINDMERTIKIYINNQLFVSGKTPISFFDKFLLESENILDVKIESQEEIVEFANDSRRFSFKLENLVIKENY